LYRKERFATQLRKISGQRRMTQKTIASKIGTTEATVSRYMSGERTPGIETIVRLSEVLKVSLDTLVGSDASESRKAKEERILISTYEQLNDGQRDAIWLVLGGFGLLSEEQQDFVFHQKKK
jgi:transcriptional regulator with XRE-family HTH domain